MVYTVTFNPAIDYVIHIGKIIQGATNRSDEEEMYFGGKGINVSIVLKELGIQSKALGFVAGFTGEAIEKGLADMGINTDFVRLKKGNSRINVKIKSEEETEINAQGPDIDENAVEELFHKLESLKDGDSLILAGSIPSSLPADIYEHIIEKIQGKNVRVAVDAEKNLLMNVLKYSPFLVKPNKHELSEMFEVEIETDEDVEKYARKLQKMGAVNVLISMAGEGAMLIDEYGKKHRCGVCRGIVRNSVGAGDSMVAGFMAGTINGDYEYALKLGTAAGGATAFSDGLATHDKIMELVKQI